MMVPATERMGNNLMKKLFYALLGFMAALSVVIAGLAVDSWVANRAFVAQLMGVPLTRDSLLARMVVVPVLGFFIGAMSAGAAIVAYRGVSELLLMCEIGGRKLWRVVDRGNHA